MSALEQPAEQERRPSPLTEHDWGRSAWKGVFLDAIARMPNVAAAARQAGVNRSTPYEAAESDEVFAAAWREAEEVGTDLLEQVALRRATVGEPKKLTRRIVRTDEKGAVVETTVTEEETNQISNALLITLLKARRPDVYRERVDHRHTGSGEGGAIKLEVNRRPSRDRILGLLQLAGELGVTGGTVNGHAIIEQGEVPDADAD